MNLELAWGRCPPRPGCAASARVTCAGWPRNAAATAPAVSHDIIDPRDLKFYRNVCGYWFAPEDDAFRWRGRLGLARAGLAELVLLQPAAVPGPCCCWAASVAWVHWALLRSCWLLPVLWPGSGRLLLSRSRAAHPGDPAALVSPADGTVTHVGEVAEPDFPGGRAFRISIFLSVFNVHVNRIPRTGRVTGIRYFPGCFLDARHPRVRRAQRTTLDRPGRSGRPGRAAARQADLRRDRPAHRLLAEAGRTRCGPASASA